MNAISLQFINYRNDQAELAGRIDHLIADAPTAGEESNPLGLVVPHAGYIYSGPIAAYAYRAIQGKDYDTVVVIGPSHRAPFKGISVLDASSFQSPLGEIPCDRELIESLLESHDNISYRPEAHSQEHSLEVQIPFLQRSLKSFKLVMAVIGSADREAEDAFTDLLAGIEGKKVLMVASSDLSHYHPYELANGMDRLAVDSVLRLNIDELNRNIRSRKCEMCGIRPVLTVMSALRKMGVEKGTLLKLANSGDTAGSKDQVVGYASVAFYRGDEEAKKGLGKGEESSSLDQASRRELLAIARRSIEETVRQGKRTEPATDNRAITIPQGAFVTIKIGGKLRGCIGNFGIRDAQPLFKTVSEMAASAAVHDPRFPPLSERELPSIELEISALTPLRPVSDPETVEVGRHGLYISKGGRSGVLLPQVATEYGWDRITFLEQTCRKAGLSRDEWKKGAAISVFEAQVFREED